jgi:putative spermidine/putrescine transport system ATP-binding protein
VLSIDMELQARRAREVFNAPRTEFVARVLGGHDVLALPKGRFAICADVVRLSDQGREAAVTAVEYQGAHVGLTARTVGNLEVLTLIPEAAVFADPKFPGDAVRFGWDDRLFNPLDA